METDLLTRHPWVSRRPITVAEYYRMAEVSILREDDRIELIEGQIIAMSPIGSDHTGAVNALNRMLVLAVGDRGVVSVQNPVRLSDRTEPEPDFAVLKPRADSYRRATPRADEVLLMIEIANSSLNYDRSVKRPLYARHGIPEFWIVNIPAGHVEVCRGPGDDDYASVVKVERGVMLEPEALPGVVISVAELLG